MQQRLTEQQSRVSGPWGGPSLDPTSDAVNVKVSEIVKVKPMNH